MAIYRKFYNVFFGFIKKMFGQWPKPSPGARSWPAQRPIPSSIEDDLTRSVQSTPISENRGGTVSVTEEQEQQDITSTF